MARVADQLKIPVMCFGLRTDFQGNLFEGSAKLLAIADILREVRTICECGSKATMVVRLDENGQVLRDGDQVSIGKQVYVSLCRRHWDERVNNNIVELEDKAQTSNLDEDEDVLPLSALG